MSTFHQLQQDLQNELTTSLQLLMQISSELQQIKEFTSPGGRLDGNIKENVSTMDTLSSFMMSDINLENVSPVRRDDIDMSNNTDQNLSYEQHDSFRDISNLNDTQ